MAQIQIPEELFLDLVAYHLLDETERAEAIAKALARKVDAVLERKYYTAYKTAPTPEQREEARQKYLDCKAYHKDFRW